MPLPLLLTTAAMLLLLAPPAPAASVVCGRTVLCCLLNVVLRAVDGAPQVPVAAVAPGGCVLT